MLAPHTHTGVMDVWLRMAVCVDRGSLEEPMSELGKKVKRLDGYPDVIATSPPYLSGRPQSKAWGRDYCWEPFYRAVEMHSV